MIRRTAYASWAILGLTLAAWVMDREPPLRYTYVEPAPVRAGEKLYIQMPAERANEDRCSVSITRYILDANGFRHDFGEVIERSAEENAAQAAAAGPYMRLAIQIPADLPPGLTTYGAGVVYVCNPLHRFWPIRVQVVVPFTVLPREGS